MRRLGREFTKYLSSTALSTMGDGLLVTGLPLLITERETRAWQVALVFAANKAAWAFALPIGALVDRRDARRVMIAMDAVRALILAALGLRLFVSDHPPELLLLILVSAAVSVGNVAFFAAAQRAIPTLVESEDLEQANSYLEAALITGDQFVGPALGGVFAKGGRIPILGDALSFVGSALILRGLRPLPPAVRGDGASVRDDVVVGWRWFRSSAPVRTLAAATAVVAFLGSSVLTNEVIIVKQTFQLRSYWLGPFTSLVAAGGIIGGLLAARIIAVLRTSTFTVCVAVSALCYLACLGNRSAPVTFVILAFQTGTVVVGNVAFSVVRQRAIPAEFRGRVIGLTRSFVFGIAPLGALFGGWIAEKHGTDPMFAVAAAGFGVVALVTARPLRTLLEPYQSARTVPAVASAASSSGAAHDG